MATRGRPSKLTEFVRATIPALLEDGNHRNVACAAVGVDYTTFLRWMADPREEYLEFRSAVIRAEIKFETDILHSLKAAALTDPKVAIEILARRHPDRWAAASRVEITEMVRREARTLADELGLDEDELVAEAEAILARNT